MGKVTKDKNLNIRINGTLKERFETALEAEGYDASDFLTMKIVELVDKIEKREQTKEEAQH